MIRYLLPALLLAFPAYGASKGFQSYDGDTTRATFRISNIDAPEIKGACAYERDLAIKARDFTRSWLAKGRVVIEQDAKRGIDPYGRVLVRIKRDGQDLGETLIKAGLARPWTGKRQPWC